MPKLAGHSWPDRNSVLNRKLLEELNIGVVRAEVDNDWDGTSLGQSIKIFRSSCSQPFLKSCKVLVSVPMLWLQHVLVFGVGFGQSFWVMVAAFVNSRHHLNIWI